MSSSELSEWIAYEKVTGPLGAERGDIQAAIIATTVANVNAGKGRKAKVKDFIPQWDRERKQTWEEQLAMVEKLNRKLGGAVVRDGVPVSPEKEPAVPNGRKKRAEG